MFFIMFYNSKEAYNNWKKQSLKEQRMVLNDTFCAKNRLQIDYYDQHFYVWLADEGL